MGARGGTLSGALRRIPGPLRPLVGATVLALSVRVVDTAWRTVTGRDAPSDTPGATPGDTPGATPADGPRLVRDRLVYALLLGGALRLARRAGLPKGDADG
jgi:hypothetical protein